MSLKEEDTIMSDTWEGFLAKNIEEKVMENWYRDANGGSSKSFHNIQAIHDTTIADTTKMIETTAAGDMSNDWFYHLPTNEPSCILAPTELPGDDVQHPPAAAGSSPGSFRVENEFLATYEALFDCQASFSPLPKADDPQSFHDSPAVLEEHLPAVPCPRSDYLFGSPEIAAEQYTSRNSPDNLSFMVDAEGSDNVSSLFNSCSTYPNLDPLTPPQRLNAHVDHSASAQLSFTNAGVDISTKDIIDNHFATLGTGLEGILLINEAEELEKEKVSEAFYGGIEVEESPSPYHAPVIDELSGFTDIREGLEDFPEQWEIQEAIPTPYGLSELPTMVQDPRDLIAVPAKTLLTPKSRKRKLNSDGKHVDAKQTFEKLEILTKVTASASTLDSNVLKRAADSDVQIVDIIDLTEDSDDDVRYLGTKKVRVSYGCAEVLVNPILPKPPVPQGYKGQFHPFLHEQRVRIGKDASSIFTIEAGSKPDPVPITTTFGDLLHPNYLFTHTAMVPEFEPEITEYTRQNLSVTSLTCSAIHHASDKTEYAASDAVAAHRTAFEENLRREAHRECAAARLEGVSVGQYRYYQGHLSIEEYKEAQICICWDECSCSKLCTRFGDMICPCSKHITVHKN